MVRVWLVGIWNLLMLFERDYIDLHENHHKFYNFKNFALNYCIHHSHVLVENCHFCSICCYLQNNFKAFGSFIYKYTKAPSLPVELRQFNRCGCKWSKHFSKAKWVITQFENNTKSPISPSPHKLSTKKNVQQNYGRPKKISCAIPLHQYIQFKWKLITFACSHQNCIGSEIENSFSVQFSRAVASWTINFIRFSIYNNFSQTKNLNYVAKKIIWQSATYARINIRSKNL